MTRRTQHAALLLLALLAAPLAGCGIKGDLKTPPPLWGPDKKAAASTPSDTDSAEGAEVDPLDEELDGFDDDIGYGVDAADE